MKFYNELRNLGTSDYPIYLTLLLLKSSERDKLTPLFWLSNELKKIPLQAPLLPGLIRLRWWHDEIQNSCQEKLIHPCLKELTDHAGPLTTIVQGYEFLLEEQILKIQHVENLARKTEIPLLRLACTMLSSHPINEIDEIFIQSLGFGLTSSYLHLQRRKIEAKGYKISLSDEELFSLMNQEFPAFTPRTQWMTPLKGFIRAMIKGFSNHRKPSLFELQRFIIGSYLKALLLRK